MNEKIVIHCDKCDSTDVMHELVTLPPREVNLTMTEMTKKMSIGSSTHDVYIYRNYRMVCKDCGHIVRYQV